MNILKLSACLILIISISGCAGSTTVRRHKDFADSFPKYNSVTILTAEMLISTQTKNGQKVAMPSPAIVNKVTQMAISELTKKGYQVKNVISDDDESEYGDEFNKSYKKSIKDLYATPEMGKQEKALSVNASLGSNVAKITRKSNADLLMVLSYNGSEMSQEQVNKSLAMDMAWSALGVENNTHTKDGSAFVSLIDGHNGNLLWTNLGVDFESYSTSVARLLTKNNVMEVAFANVLKTLPDKTKQ